MLIHIRKLLYWLKSTQLLKMYRLLLSKDLLTLVLYLDMYSSYLHNHSEIWPIRCFRKLKTNRFVQRSRNVNKTVSPKSIYQYLYIFR